MKNAQMNMKKVVVIAAWMIGAIISVSAQRGEVGFRFMPTLSSFDLRSSSGGTVSGQVTLGYGAGLLLGVNVNQHVGVQGEVIYSSLSQKYKESDVERRVKLNYVNIPLLLSLNTGKTKIFNLNIVAGPQIGISAGTKLTISGGDGSTAPAVLSVKKGDLGIAYGAGIDFGVNDLHNVRFGVGYRGVLGLFDISDNNGSITTDSYYILDRTHVKSNAAYIGISYLF